MSRISWAVGARLGCRSGAGCVSECAPWECSPTGGSRAVIFRSASGIGEADVRGGGVSRKLPGRLFHLHGSASSRLQLGEIRHAHGQKCSARVVMTPVPAGDEPDDLTGLLRRPVLPHPRTPPDREPGAYAGASGGRHLAPVPQVCVVVPTRNEERNVEPLLRRLEAALRG